jgi:hypothetical protein
MSSINSSSRRKDPKFEVLVFLGSSHLPREIIPQDNLDDCRAFIEKYHAPQEDGLFPPQRCEIRQDKGVKKGEPCRWSCVWAKNKLHGNVLRLHVVGRRVADTNVLPLFAEGPQEHGSAIGAD